MAVKDSFVSVSDSVSDSVVDDQHKQDTQQQQGNIFNYHCYAHLYLQVLTSVRSANKIKKIVKTPNFLVHIWSICTHMRHRRLCSGIELRIAKSNILVTFAVPSKQGG